MSHPAEEEEELLHRHVRVSIRGTLRAFGCSLVLFPMLTKFYTVRNLVDAFIQLKKQHYNSELGHVFLLGLEKYLVRTSGGDRQKCMRLLGMCSDIL
jgi:hypothetical protein